MIEDLKPKNMSKIHKLASAILDANFGRMRQFLEYKCAWLGILLFFAPQFYASSRYCSHCGQYYNKALTLNDREWICPTCGTYLDRDQNAALNILHEGNRIRLSGNTSGTDGTDKSVKHVDTGKVTYLEQEACNATDGWDETHPSSVGG